MKKIKLLVMAVLLTSVFSIGAYAQSDEVTTEEFSIGNTIIKSMTRSSSDPLSYVSDSISDSGSYLAISSKTYSAQTCDELKLVINVQEKVNGYWTTVDTFTYTSYNTSSITKYPSYYGINSGSQYRVKTSHYATIDGSTYSQTNISSTITAN